MPGVPPVIALCKRNTFWSKPATIQRSSWNPFYKELWQKNHPKMAQNGQKRPKVGQEFSGQKFFEKNSYDAGGADPSKWVG